MYGLMGGERLRLIVVDLARKLGQVISGARIPKHVLLPVFTHILLLVPPLERSPRALESSQHQPYRQGNPQP
jgi:hypothetical protein